MDAAILKKLKIQLEERKTQIENELASFAKKDVKTPGDYDTQFPDFGTTQSSDEDALKITVYGNTLPVEYALELRLAAINKALEKIAQNKYGFCEKCGQPIEQKRLEAIAEARNCVKCQTD